MSSVPRARNVFEHLRRICQRPGLFATNFTLEHLFIYLVGYDDALEDAGVASPQKRFDEWVYQRRPAWRHLPEWWARQMLVENDGDLERTLGEIIQLVDQFLASDGAEFARTPSHKSSD